MAPGRFKTAPVTERDNAHAPQAGVHLYHFAESTCSKMGAMRDVEASAGAEAGSSEGAGFDGLEVLDGFRATGAAKESFVRELFDRVAPRYDLVNLLISLGQTTLWRWLALGWLGTRELPKDARVVDVGCGTGAAAALLLWRYRGRGVRVEGVDNSTGMLDIARERHPGVGFALGDACALPCETGAFDLAVTVYTLRNFSSLDAGLAELVRVTRPGGAVIILDAFPVRSAVLRFLLSVWLDVIMPRLAGLFQDAKAYRYLATSIQNTVSADTVASRLQELGCVDVRVTPYTFGACCRVLAHKPAAAETS